MYANIARMGNSQRIQIPQTILSRAGLRENDRVEISCQEDSITIRKAFRHRTLEERLTAFYGKPLREIAPVVQREYDWGGATGDETW